jgi:POLQ-like helicase
VLNFEVNLVENVIKNPETCSQYIQIRHKQEARVLLRPHKTLPQLHFLNLRAIHDRSNLIYALPTSGGKTLVAEIVMTREVVLRKKNVIFVLPYVSIVQEKVQDLMPFALEFDFLVEEYCAGKGKKNTRKKNTIYICTIEKSQILFDSLYENGRLGEIGLIVVDELHMAMSIWKLSS